MLYCMDLDFWRMQINAEYIFCGGKTWYESEIMIKEFIQAVPGKAMPKACSQSAKSPLAEIIGIFIILSLICKRFM